MPETELVWENLIDLPAPEEIDWPTWAELFNIENPWPRNMISVTWVWVVADNALYWEVGQ